MSMTISKATLKDVGFIVKSIIEAEKSGTDKLSFSSLFGMSEHEVELMLHNILEEELDGCELSLSSFIIAKDGNNYAGAIGGWVEGKNEDQCPSAILKANLLSYFMNKDNLLHMRETSKYVADLEIERTIGSYQIEYVYVEPQFRGQGVVQKLMEAHQELAEKECGEMQVILCSHNMKALSAYSKFGFAKAIEKSSDNPKVLDYLPDNNKLLMIKTL